ncbi:hypothetical protein [Allopontixanthobacter sp.]|uniref:hypothetical protein n=1 Tax=Allopontixanthobacter sp. TaxID=2906452 RepID=UPI002ABC69C7|nr:hypothetical protein [Allopontixanthobacter sp.]MDZ4306647.1 hypothetical protein [Allopontixanthobacter sp.]
MIRNRPLLEQINRVSRVYSNQDGMEQTKRADYLPSAGALVEAKEDCGRYFGVTDKWWRADIGLHLIKVRVALSE